MRAPVTAPRAMPIDAANTKSETNQQTHVSYEFVV